MNVENLSINQLTCRQQIGLYQIIHQDDPYLAWSDIEDKFLGSVDQLYFNSWRTRVSRVIRFRGIVGMEQWIKTENAKLAIS